MEYRAGSLNQEHAIYKNHCCGDELVLYRGIVFPNCKKHKDIETRWQLVGTIAMGRVDYKPRGGKPSGSGNPAA